MEILIKHPILALLALSLMATPALAEHHEGQHGGDKDGRHKAMMAKVDTDKDGKISRAEFQARGEQMFKEADANGDGFITPEEGKAAHEARREKWKARKAEYMKKREAAASSAATAE